MNKVQSSSRRISVIARILVYKSSGGKTIGVLLNKQEAIEFCINTLKEKGYNCSVETGRIKNAVALYVRTETKIGSDVKRVISSPLRLKVNCNNPDLIEKILLDKIASSHNLSHNDNDREDILSPMLQDMSAQIDALKSENQMLKNQIAALKLERTEFKAKMDTEMAEIKAFFNN
jgi:organic radical activating enzyme